MSDAEAPVEAPAAPQTIPMKDPSGEVADVPVENAAKALQLGFKDLSPEEYKQNWQQKEYGGVGGQIGAGLAGAARGVSFGLSDRALANTGLVDTGTLKNLEEANPGASTAGELGGLVGSSFVGLGEGALAAKAGEAVGAGVTKLVGETAGMGLAKRVLAKAAEKSAAGAAEGAVLGVQHPISEDALGESELTAEKLAASVGMSALFGGVAGGALSGGADLVRAGAGKAAEVIGEKLAGSTIAEKAANWLDEIAGEQASRATFGQQKRAVKQLFNKPGFEEGSENRWDDAKKMLRGLIETGDTNESIAEKLTAREAQAGSDVRDYVARLDAVSQHIPASRVSAEEVADRIEREVAEKFKGSAAQGEFYDAVKKEADKIRSLGDGPSGTVATSGNGRTLSFAEASKQRADLQELINYDQLNPTPMLEARRKMATIWNRIIDEKAAPILEELGESKDAYRLARQQFGLIKEVKGYADDRLVSNAVNRIASASDHGVGIGLGLGGAVAGIGGPASLALGAASAIGNKVARTYGNAAASEYAGKAAVMLRALKGTEATTGKISEAINGFVKRAEGAKRIASKATIPSAVEVVDKLHLGDVGTKAAKNDDERMKSKMRQIAALTSDPARLTDNTSRSIAAVHGVAPKLAGQLALKASKAAMFLAAKVPKDPTPPSIIPQQRDKWQPSKADIAKFARYARAVDDPTTVLDDLKHGRLSSEGVEAMREVYPKLYESVRQSLVERVGELKKDLPYDARVQLSLLFGVPLDPTLDPGFVNAIQSGYKQTPQTHAPTQPAGPGSLTLHDRLAPDSARLSSND